MLLMQKIVLVLVILYLLIDGGSMLEYTYFFSFNKNLDIIKSVEINNLITEIRFCLFITLTGMLIIDKSGVILSRKWEKWVILFISIAHIFFAIIEATHE
jgi:hypothetical protein